MIINTLDFETTAYYKTISKIKNLQTITFATEQAAQYLLTTAKLTFQGNEANSKHYFEKTREVNITGETCLETWHNLHFIFPNINKLKCEKIYYDIHKTLFSPNSSELIEKTSMSELATHLIKKRKEQFLMEQIEALENSRLNHIATDLAIEGTIELKKTKNEPFNQRLLYEKRDILEQTQHEYIKKQEDQKTRNITVTMYTAIIANTTYLIQPKIIPGDETTLICIILCCLSFILYSNIKKPRNRENEITSIFKRYLRNTIERRITFSPPAA